MAGTSKKTKMYGTRLLLDDAAVLERRAKKAGMGVSEYLRRETEFWIRRKHR